jgi:uncharacterized protein (TIRG00374 family)
VVQLPRLKRFLQYGSAVVLTVVLLALFLWKSNLHQVGHILESTSIRWLLLGLLINFTALILRTFRWRILIDPDHPPPFYPTFFANTIGYMLSTILPIRAGDVARPALLARRTNVRFTGALGTVLTERILDLFSLLGLFIYYCLAHWNDYSHDPSVARYFFIIRSGAIGAAVVLLALVLFIFGLYFFRPLVRRMHEFVGRILPKRFRTSWMHFFDAFTETLNLAGHPVGLLKVLGCTVGIWLCLTAQFWFVTLALHHPLPFDSSFFVTGLTTVGLAVPTPGGVGGFHKACQLVLTTFYGFDVDLSVAVALLFHMVGTLPVLLAGLGLFLREGVRWGDIRSEAQSEPADKPAE